jgi:opacity protein-like surface antigen
MNKLQVSMLGVSAGLALALFVGPANADGYVRGSIKDAPAPCCDSWSGFYVGVHGGYGWKDNDFAEVIQTNPLLTIGGIDSKGSVFGGQAGYNWQRGLIVGGLEIDFSHSNIKGNSAPVIRNFAGGLTITDIEGDDVRYLGTARARLGFAPGACCSNFLVYGTAGLAWERVDRIDTERVVTPAVTQTAVTRDPRDWFGWVAGVGAEAKLAGTGWVGRVEYLHYDFGTVEATTTVISTPGTSFSDTAGRQTIDVVRAGLSYKF